MSKILGAAEEWNYISENVVQKTKLPRRQFGAERVVLTPVQVRDLIAKLNGPARSVTLLLVLTGLRVGELLALRWGSIDLKARMLRVCETVYDGHFDNPKRNAVREPFRLGWRQRKYSRVSVLRLLDQMIWCLPHAKDRHYIDGIFCVST